MGQLAKGQVKDSYSGGKEAEGPCCKVRDSKLEVWVSKLGIAVNRNSKLVVKSVSWWSGLVC